MDGKIKSIIDSIRALEDQLEAEMATRRTELQYHIEQKRVVFEQSIARRHAALKTKLSTYVFGARPLMIITAPFIYILIVPFVLLDIFVSLYQLVCFPVYGIPKVARADYMVFDRANLKYLNLVEKINCAYCSYGNGVVGYVREVASRTEQYWCPIKHARRMAGAHGRYNDFVDFGDADGYHAMQAAMRVRLREEAAAKNPQPL